MTTTAPPVVRAVPRLRAPVRVVFGPPIPLTVTGDPRARSTVRDAAEQLRAGLVDHLRHTTLEA